MDIFGFKARQKNILLDKEIKRKDGQLQEMAGVLTYKQEEETDYKGNAYVTYPAAVAEINKKYKGIADWGIWAGNIIDVRAAFIMGRGLNVITEDDKKAKKELEWANEFLDYNDLILKVPLLLATEGEIEGKFLLPLYKIKEPPFVKVGYISWTDKDYKIVADPQNYLKYLTASYKEGSGDVVLTEPEFVYRKFGGRVFIANEACPKMWRSLNEIDDVSKALKDLRTINNLLALPTPYFKCETIEEAQGTREWIASHKNWRLGKAFVGTSDFSFVEISTANSQILEKEIEDKIKIISGNVGVPVHFMGLPDLMSNRSTAENLMEFVWASTRRERETWESAYTEVLRKSMVMATGLTGKTPLDPMKIKVEITEVTTNEFKHIAEAWLPLFRENAISLGTLLSKIPDIDPTTELKTLEKEKAEREEKMLNDFNAGFATNDNEEDEDKNNINNEEK